MTRRTKRLLVMLMLAAALTGAEVVNGALLAHGISWPNMPIGFLVGTAIGRIWFLGRQDGMEYGNYDGGWVKERDDDDEN